MAKQLPSPAVRGQLRALLAPRLGARIAATAKHGPFQLGPDQLVVQVYEAPDGARHIVHVALDDLATVLGLTDADLPLTLAKLAARGAGLGYDRIFGDWAVRGRVPTVEEAP